MFGRRTVEITDPRALRAVAHPIRLRLIGLLRHEGPLTATEAGRKIGESSGSCSFHLRQLAKYGLVEDAGGGRGRRRPWRATAQFTTWPTVAPTPELAAASELFERVVAERYQQRIQRWISRRQTQPVEWQEAALFGDTTLYVTARELADLGKELDALLEPYLERAPKRELRPDGARPVAFLRLAFPSDLDD